MYLIGDGSLPSFRPRGRLASKMSFVFIQLADFHSFSYLEFDVLLACLALCSQYAP